MKTHGVRALGLLFSWISPRKKTTGRRAREPGCAGLPNHRRPCRVPRAARGGERVPPRGQGLPWVLGAARAPQGSAVAPCYIPSAGLGAPMGVTGRWGAPCTPDTVCWWLCCCKVGLDPPKVELDPPKFCSRGS